MYVRDTKKTDLNRSRNEQNRERERIIKIFNLENIQYTLGKHHILFIFNKKHYIYTNQDEYFDTSLFYSEYPEEIEITYNFFIQCYEVPHFIKKLPYGEKEFYLFFKDIIEDIEYYFYDNLSLQDIYYSVEDKKYIILAPYYKRLSRKIDICISNIFQDKSVYFYKDTEIKTIRDLNNLERGGLYD